MRWKPLVMLAIGLSVLALTPESADAAMRGRRGGVSHHSAARGGSVHSHRAYHSRTPQRSQRTRTQSHQDDRQRGQDQRRDVRERGRDRGDYPNRGDRSNRGDYPNRADRPDRGDYPNRGDHLDRDDREDRVEEHRRRHAARAVWRRDGYYGGGAYYGLDNCGDLQLTIVDGISYKLCDGQWYERVHQDGDVMYVPCDPPPGS